VTGPPFPKFAVPLCSQVFFICREAALLTNTSAAAYQGERSPPRCFGAGVLMIRFFGSHEEYDGIDAETV